MILLIRARVLSLQRCRDSLACTRSQKCLILHFSSRGGWYSLPDGPQVPQTPQPGPAPLPPPPPITPGACWGRNLFKGMVIQYLEPLPVGGKTGESTASLRKETCSLHFKQLKISLGILFFFCSKSFVAENALVIFSHLFLPHTLNLIALYSFFKKEKNLNRRLHAIRNVKLSSS